MLVGENMKTFEIKDEFIVDGKPIKILSGAIHYFRIVPKHWEDSLYNLKALGLSLIHIYTFFNCFFCSMLTIKHCKIVFIFH